MRVSQKEIKYVAAIMGGYAYVLNKVEIITLFNKVVMSGITYTNENTPVNIGQVKITTNKGRRASGMAVTKTRIIQQCWEEYKSRYNVTSFY